MSVSKQSSASASFWTPSGVEVPAVTTDVMREIDRIAMEETGPNLFQMMENAGRSLAEMTMECAGPNWRQTRIVVLAGPGGNGGGGIAAARHLANHGATVELCLAAPDKLGAVPAWQHKILRSTSAQELLPRDLDREPPLFIVDALIGYGLQSAPRGVFADLIAWANSTGAPILSLDVPSGTDSTTGETSRRGRIRLFLGKAMVKDLISICACKQAGSQKDVPRRSKYWRSDLAENAYPFDSRERAVELTSQVGGTILDGLGYLNALAFLGGRTAYFTIGSVKDWFL